MIIQTAFNWLIDQQLLLSALFAGFILLERFGLKAFGAGFIYKLLWLAPLALVIANLPNTIKPLQNSAISHYLITPNQPLINSISLNWAMAYLLISVLLLIAALTVHIRFINSLQLKQLTNCSHNIVNVKTYSSEYVATPMVVGVLQSKLVLPSNYNVQFDKATLALILEHEHVHIKRKDNLLNMLLLMTTLVFWFNPLAWLGYLSFRRLQELSCDEKVLMNKTTLQRILYSKALINCAANTRAGLMAYSHYGDKNTMLQRLNQIKHTGNSSTIAKGALLIFAAGMLSSVAIAKQPEAKTAKQSISPTMRIEPFYPIQAAEQGISGSVVLKYDINPAGNTANISVVNAKPEGVFNREAKKALKQWQYKPSDSGFKDVLVQLDFAIDKHYTSEDLIEKITVAAK